MKFSDKANGFVYRYYNALYSDFGFYGMDGFLFICGMIGENLIIQVICSCFHF